MKLTGLYDFNACCFHSNYLFVSIYSFVLRIWIRKKKRKKKTKKRKEKKRKKKKKKKNKKKTKKREEKKNIKKTKKEKEKKNQNLEPQLFVILFIDISFV